MTDVKDVTGTKRLVSMIFIEDESGVKGGEGIKSTRDLRGVKSVARVAPHKSNQRQKCEKCDRRYKCEICYMCQK